MATKSTNKVKSAPKKVDFMRGINRPFNPTRFASDLQKKLTKENASFRDVAKLTGLSASTVYNMTAELREPTASGLASVCNWMGVPVQTYFKS